MRPKNHVTRDRLKSLYMQAEPMQTTQFKDRKLFEEPDTDLAFLPLRWVGQLRESGRDYDVLESGGSYYRIESSLMDIEMELDHLRLDPRGTVIKE